MKPLYLIVHPQSITYRERSLQPEVASELDRIMEEEKYFLLKEDTTKIPKWLSKEREIRVCGAFYEICVWEVFKTLNEQGYKVTRYDKASFNTIDTLNKKL